VGRTTWRCLSTSGSFISNSRMSSSRVGTGPSNTVTGPMSRDVAVLGDDELDVQRAHRLPPP
jgi:hypothetical protein